MPPLTKWCLEGRQLTRSQATYPITCYIVGPELSPRVRIILSWSQTINNMSILIQNTIELCKVWFQMVWHERRYMRGYMFMEYTGRECHRGPRVAWEVDSQLLQICYIDHKSDKNMNYLKKKMLFGQDFWRKQYYFSLVTKLLLLTWTKKKPLGLQVYYVA